MQAIFWGARGSLPASVNNQTIHEKINLALIQSLDHNLSSESDVATFIDNELPFEIKGGYGCNTSCVEIKAGEEYVLCDAGSGRG